MINPICRALRCGERRRAMLERASSTSIPLALFVLSLLVSGFYERTLINGDVICRWLVLSLLDSQLAVCINSNHKKNKQQKTK